MRKFIYYLTVLLLFSSCRNSDSSEIETNDYVSKIRKGLEDNAFKLNGSFNILELKIHKSQTMRLDSVYRELAFGRLNKLFKDLERENNPDYNSIDKDKELIRIKNRIDETLGQELYGKIVWYYVKGTYVNGSRNQSNILYDTVVSYFDNNKNLLRNNLYFDDWRFANQ